MAIIGALDQYKDDYAYFLQQLKAARKDAEMRQGDVATHMGRAQSWVSKIESGELRVDFIELVHLARLYRQPLTFFEPPARVNDR